MPHRASVSVGGTFVGEFETNGDWDWIEVQLTAGETYTITLDGYGADPNDNPYLIVYAPGAVSYSNATTVASDNNGGAGSLASVTITASETGTFYIEAWDAYNDGGDYQISVNTATVEMLEEWTDEQIATQLTETYWGGTARSWDTSADNIITYNISSLSPAYQAFALAAFEVWSSIADIEFVSTTGSADLTFQDTASGAYASSSMSFSGGKLYITSSTINVQQGWSGDDNTLQTFIHEIGHALGLGHAGGYNGSATYSQFNNADADYLNDSWQASVMSYFSQTENTYVEASFAYLLTPMMADIIAIQELYGAATDTNLGNSTFGYNNNTGNANYNASVLDDSGTNYALTIVDHGGEDTIDLSGSTDNNTIDLTPGSFSSTGGLKGNLGIGGSTIIENAIGGSGNDILTGNGAANKLYGGAGDDSLDAGASSGGWQYSYGGGGDDTYRISKDNGSVFIDPRQEGADDGDNDRVVFTDINFSDLTIDFLEYSDGQIGNALRLMWDDGIDSGELRIGQEGRYIEAYQFADGTTMTWQDFQDELATIIGSNASESLYGDNGDNVLMGLGGNDRLYGGGGNDTLDTGASSGGFQYSYGGGGDDTYRISKDNGSVFIDPRQEGADDGDNDRVVFTDINFSDLSIDTFEYSINGVGTAIRLMWDDGNDSGELRIGQQGRYIEAYQFADGTTMTWQDFQQPTTTGGSNASESLYGDKHSINIDERLLYDSDYLFV